MLMKRLRLVLAVAPALILILGLDGNALALYDKRGSVL